MGIASDLVVELVKSASGDKKSKEESTSYGTIVKYNNATYVQLDGSDLLTPVSTTTDTKDGERVTVLIKNHNAIVTGNISSPAARSGDLQNVVLDANEIGNQIAEFEIVIANKVSTSVFEAERARIDSLVADSAIIKTELEAQKAEINELIAEDLTVSQTLTAHAATIEELQTKKLDAEIADLKYATIEDLEATDLDVYNLSVTYGQFEVLTANRLTVIEGKIESLEVGSFDAVYANVDFSNIGTAAIQQFFSKSGLIEDVVVGDQSVTGKLVGVTISGDLIEGNTVVAEKLVIKGEDGLYYKLNTDGITTEAEQTDENSLNGSIIKAKSITASKVDVNDLVAFDATIGGFSITNNSIYSGVKETIDNTTRGIYMDSEAQFYIGDTDNYLKYYKDDEGNYKLEISAESILFGANSKSSVSDLKALTEHVRVSTYTDPDTAEVNPSIELAEGDSDFKQVITNKKVMIMDGNVVRTEMNSDGVVTDNVTIKNELRHGKWLWQTRSNGNYGLSWKG